MTETIMAKEMVDALKADYVVPLVAYLVHESCQETSGLFEVGAGFITKHRFQRTKGHSFDFEGFTAEKVRDNWSKIVDWTNAFVPESLNDTTAEAMNNIERNQKLTAKKTSGAELKADGIFSMMGEFLARGEGKELIPKVDSVFQFDIFVTKGTIAGSWIIDLKNGQGHVQKGVAEKPDATFTMSDEDFDKVCLGTLNPQMAFMQGKMKIKGNMGKATKFTPELFPPPTPENVAKFKAAKL